jgi:predicted Zn-dependent peptidase
MTILNNIVPVGKEIHGRNVCIISDPKSNMIYASVTLRGGFYTEQRRSDLGITHLIEHILFESWKKCYDKDAKSKSKSKSKLKSKRFRSRSRSLTHPNTIKIKTLDEISTKKTKRTTSQKNSCLRFWNNRPVKYNGSTSYQKVTAYIYGLASESDDLVDYITQMICTCPDHLNLKMLDHVKKTVLNELTAIQTKVINKLEMGLISKYIEPETNLQSGALRIGDESIQIENLKKITPEHIRDYYYQFFIPENAVFLYAGHVTESQVRKIIGRHLSYSSKSYTVPHTGLTFDPRKIFSNEFTSTQNCLKPIGSNKHKNVINMNKNYKVFKNPAVKDNAFFMIILPDFNFDFGSDDLHSIQKSAFSSCRKTQLFYSVISAELHELLRMNHNLVYGVSATYTNFTGLKMVQISGTCHPADVKTVIGMCLAYIQQRQNSIVPESTISSVKNRIKMDTFTTSFSLIDIAGFFESVIQTVMIENGSSSINDIVVKNSKFISYNESVNQLDQVSATDILNRFKSICLSNAVSGYSIK